MKLLVATNNKDKQLEFSQILANSGVEIIFPQDVGLGELDVDEIGKTIEANSRLKAETFSERSGLPTVADDSGLEVKALGGAPGVKSKRFIGGSDEARCQKILNLLAEQKVGEAPYQRQAQFKCVLTYIDPQANQTQVFTGVFEGSIALRPAGKSGFGYDPIFIPRKEIQTVAELGQAYKNKHSHRAQAINKLATYLETISHA